MIKGHSRVRREKDLQGPSVACSRAVRFAVGQILPLRAYEIRRMSKGVCNPRGTLQAIFEDGRAPCRQDAPQFRCVAPEDVLTGNAKAPPRCIVIAGETILENDYEPGSSLSGQ